MIENPRRGESRGGVVDDQAHPPVVSTTGCGGPATSLSRTPRRAGVGQGAISPIASVQQAANQNSTPTPKSGSL